MTVAVTGAVSAERMRRLRWRARRGLLENDLLLERFFALHGGALTDRQISGLDALLDLPDNELLDLVLGRADEASASLSSETIEVLGLLRRC